MKEEYGEPDVLDGDIFVCPNKQPKYLPYDALMSQELEKAKDDDAFQKFKDKNNLRL